jgi:hypothetical protein
MSPKSVAILFAVVVALSLSGTKASPAAAKNVKTLGSASRQLNPAVRKSKSSSSGGSGDSSSGSNANESGDYAIGDCEALVDGKPFDGIQCYTGGCCASHQIAPRSPFLASARHMTVLLTAVSFFASPRQERPAVQRCGLPGKG